MQSVCLGGGGGGGVVQAVVLVLVADVAVVVAVAVGKGGEKGTLPMLRGREGMEDAPSGGSGRLGAHAAACTRTYARTRW